MLGLSTKISSINDGLKLFLVLYISIIMECIHRMGYKGWTEWDDWMDGIGCMGWDG